MRATHRYIVLPEGLMEVPTRSAGSDHHYVQPDFTPFKSPDGQYITGRTHWRDHLKQTGSIEMGHTDIQGQREEWKSRRGKFQEKVALGEKIAPEHHGPLSSPDQQRILPALYREMAQKLDGRPMPDRKTMIQLTIETGRELNRRGRR